MNCRDLVEIMSVGYASPAGKRYIGRTVHVDVVQVRKGLPRLRRTVDRKRAVGRSVSGND
jgi:hypothetical protein